MSARDDYPVIAAQEALEWRGASAQFGRALDEIDRLRAVVEAARVLLTCHPDAEGPAMLELDEAVRALGDPA